MNDDKALNALETQLMPTPKLITDDVPDVTEKIVEAMDK